MFPKSDVVRIGQEAVSAGEFLLQVALHIMVVNPILVGWIALEQLPGLNNDIVDLVFTKDLHHLRRGERAASSSKFGRWHDETRPPERIAPCSRQAPIVAT